MLPLGSLVSLGSFNFLKEGMDNKTIKGLEDITNKLTEEIRSKIKKEVSNMVEASTSTSTSVEELDNTLSKLLVDYQGIISIDEIYGLLCRYKAIYEVFLTERIRDAIQFAKIRKSADETPSIQPATK